MDDPVKIVIGNKCDLNDKKQVYEEDMKALSEMYDVEVYEASAKEAIKVNDIMEMMTRKLMEKR